MVRHLPRAVLFAAALALLSPGQSLSAQSRDDARAANQAQPEVTLSADGETLYLVGMLLDGAFHQVDAALRRAPRVRRVHLSSSGGFTIEGRLVAALVRKHRLDTYVEFYCASACTQVFAAGQQRVIGPQARLGFHQAVMVDSNGMTAGVRARTDRKLDPATVFGVNGNDTLRLAYELAGTKPAFIDKALDYSPENMWLPEPAELLDAGLVTRLAQRSEIEPPGNTVTHETVRTALLEQPLWRAALVRFPTLTEQGVSEVWRLANTGLALGDAALAGRAKLVAEASKLLVTADDALLEQALATYAMAARSQRARGYPGCRADPVNVPRQDPEDIAILRAEDAMLTALMLSAPQAKPMKITAAERYFGREVSPMLVESVALNDGTGQDGLCRIGFDTFEAIDALPRPKQLKAYRALLSLPDRTGH